MDVEETQKIFPDHDANNDGKVTWAEYSKKMKSDENDTTSESFKTVSTLHKTYLAGLQSGPYLLTGFVAVFIMCRPISYVVV